MKQIKSVVCTVAIGLILIAQLMRPVMAYADGEITPTPTDTGAVTSTPVPTDTPTEIIPSETPMPPASPSPTDVPVETSTLTPEATATPELIETTVVLVDTDTSTPEPPTEIVETVTPTLDPTETTLTAADVPAIDQPTLLETVQTIPGDPSVVVLDENGQPLSLASQAAADVIANSDPMWCPSAVTPGDPTCTIGYLTVAELISNLAGKSGAGTIYFTSTYTTNDATFDHTNANLSNLTNLTIQGGWNGLTGGSYALSGNSVFTVPISILNWNNSVTVNNVTINNSSNGGLYVNTNDPSANVTINTVTVDHASGFGLGILTYGGSATVTNSTFSNTVAGNNLYFPYGDGADIMTNGGNVDISGSKFIKNELSGGYGAWISAGSTGNITLKSSEFSDNNWGMVPFSSNNISIYNTNTFQNNYIGIGYSDCKGNLALEQGINFSGNTYDVYNLGGCADPINLVSTTPAPIPSTVDVQNDKVFSLDCSVSDRTYSINLPNGDLVEIYCPAVGDASIARLDSTILPANLPDGYTYASAFEVDIKQGEIPIPVIEQGGYIRASFLASYLQPGSAYDILYWDAWEVEDGKLVPLETGKWVPLKDFLLQAKGPRSFDLDPETDNLVVRKIISGVRLLSKNTDKRVEVIVNFPGIFVLAQH